MAASEIKDAEFLPLIDMVVASVCVENMLLAEATVAKLKDLWEEQLDVRRCSPLLKGLSRLESLEAHCWDLL